MSPLEERSRPPLPIILGIIALLLSGLYVAGLILDWPSWIHGSNWVWVRRVPQAGWRSLLMPAAFATGATLAFIAIKWRSTDGEEWSQRYTWLFLAIIVVLAPLLQILIAMQHQAQPLSLVTMSATGFWQEGVRIEDPIQFIRDHTAQMPSYRDVHVRTHPPGWPLVYWATSQGFAAAPAAADIIGGWVHRYDCTALELSGLQPAQLAAGTVRIIILALSGFGILPFFAIARRFYPLPIARLATVGFAFMPGLLVFSGRFDVVYLLLGLFGAWLALRAVYDNRLPSALLLAIILALASFLSFTALAVGAFIFLIIAIQILLNRDSSAFKRLLFAAGLVGAGQAILWGGLWFLLGVDGLEMWRSSQEIHRTFRINYPAWFLFNWFDLAVFMGFVPFVGAIGALTHSLWKGDKSVGSSRGVILGWSTAILLLNLSATVRAETGRLWLFTMPFGLLIGLTYFAGQNEPRPRSRRWLAVLFGAFLIQALMTGYFLGGRVSPSDTPSPTWDLPGNVIPTNYKLGDSVKLRGYDLRRVDNGLGLTLYWQSLAFHLPEYSVFVHALDSTGAMISQSDGPPVSVPMWCWVPGEIVADERHIESADGAVELGVGVYDPLMGIRLPVSPLQPDDRILLPVPAER